jgi:hypothetical protein
MQGHSSSNSISGSESTTNTCCYKGHSSIRPMEHITVRVIQDERAAKEAFTKMSTNNNARISTINVYLINIIFTHQCVCSRVSNVRYLPPANSFFILSIRTMAKSILYICCYKAYIGYITTFIQCSLP